MKIPITTITKNYKIYHKKYLQGMKGTFAKNVVSCYQFYKLRNENLVFYLFISCLKVIQKIFLYRRVSWITFGHILKSVAHINTFCADLYHLKTYFILSLNFWSLWWYTFRIIFVLNYQLSSCPWYKKKIRFCDSKRYNDQVVEEIWKS